MSRLPGWFPAEILSVALCLTLCHGLAVSDTADAQIPNSGSAPAPSAIPDVTFHGIKANKVLFLGNSITLHEPAPAIGWHGNWGMAASSQENDYVHLVLKAIAKTAGREPESLVINLADFERQHETYDPNAGLKQALAFRPELVIVAIGENVPALCSEHAKTSFLAKMVKLLQRFNADGNPLILVRSCFWPEPVRDTILKQACQEVGGIFVDIGPLGRDEANFARSERQFSHAGVAVHPGDKGMKAIADAILKALEQKGK